MKLRTIVLATASIGSAFAIGRWSAGKEGRDVDRELFAELNRGHGPDADRFFTGVTELGSLWAAAAAAAALAILGRRRTAANALGAAGIAWIAGQGLKRMTDRRRPYEEDSAGTRTLVGPPEGSSWPSSHPAVLTAFTTVAGRDLGLGAIARAGLTGLGLSVGASRVYVGVHYPSDAASGFLIGRAIARCWSGRRR